MASSRTRCLARQHHNATATSRRSARCTASWPATPLPPPPNPPSSWRRAKLTCIRTYAHTTPKPVAHSHCRSPAAARRAALCAKPRGGVALKPWPAPPAAAASCRPLPPAACPQPGPAAPAPAPQTLRCAWGGVGGVVLWVCAKRDEALPLAPPKHSAKSSQCTHPARSWTPTPGWRASEFASPCRVGGLWAGGGGCAVGV